MDKGIGGPTTDKWQRLPDRLAGLILLVVRYRGEVEDDRIRVVRPGLLYGLTVQGWNDEERAADELTIKRALDVRHFVSSTVR